MKADKFDLLGPALNEVGKEAVRLADSNSNGIFLYVEIGDGWVSSSLFKEGELTITYVDARMSPLDRLIEEAWYLEPADKRWTTMQMSIHDNHFTSQFDYDDIEHSSETIEDRRPRILRARYGDKPIIYPPLRRRGWDLTPPA